MYNNTVHKTEDFLFLNGSKELADGVHYTATYLRNEPWSLPLIAVAIANSAVIIAYEIYVIIRAFHGTPSRRHLFLGQCLLAGLLIMSLTGIPLALRPTPWACTISGILTGIGPASVFGTLLVKCIFLVSLNSGVYLPAYYQGVLLFFVILVQGVIHTQWLSSQSSDVIELQDYATMEVFLTCSSSYRQYVGFLIYVVALIIVVATVSLKCRNIRENYRESSYIGLSVGILLPYWMMWTLAGFILPQRIQPACIGFGIVISASVVFIIMFIPKGRQLSAVGQDGLYKKDREDSLSSFSSARYSPSFFLFKPVKTTKELLGQNSIYKANISDKIYGQPVPRLVNPPKPAATISQPSYRFALPKYAQSPSQVWPLYNYYRHYYPVRAQRIY